MWCSVIADQTVQIILVRGFPTCAVQLSSARRHGNLMWWEPHLTIKLTLTLTLNPNSGRRGGLRWQCSARWPGRSNITLLTWLPSLNFVLATPLPSIVVTFVITQIGWNGVYSETGWRQQFTWRTSGSELQRHLGISVWLRIRWPSSLGCLPLSRFHVRFT